MSERIKNQYNSLYAAQENFFGEGKPTEVVCQLKKYLVDGTVLDIGGGEGRNALYLARQGFFVSVLDVSEVGIEKLKTKAEEQQLNIETHVSDVVIDVIEGTYDSVILSFVLHHLNDVDAIKIIVDAQEHTAKKGVHIISTFMDKGDLYTRNKKSERFYPSKEILEELYADWDIKELSEYEEITHARNKTGERMKNFVVTLMAIKNDFGE